MQQPSNIRKSEHTRKPTEKGKTLLDDKLNELNVKFVKMYRRWKYHMDGLKRSIKKSDAADLIDDVISAINIIQVDIDDTYLKIRDISSPEPYIWRMNDTCHALTGIANKKADSEVIPWPDNESVFDNTGSSVSSVKTSESKTSSKVSKQSSNLSLHVKQAAAEVAATQEVIKIMNASTRGRNSKT